jgi:hypothetical protein
MLTVDSVPFRAFPRVPTSKNSIGGSGILQIALLYAAADRLDPCNLGLFVNYRLVIRCPRFSDFHKPCPVR